MAFVQRANVVLEVNDDAVERMRNAGYNVIDESGAVIQRSTANNFESLSILYNEALREIEQLREENAKFKKENKTLKAKNKGQKK